MEKQGIISASTDSSKTKLAQMFSLSCQGRYTILTFRRCDWFDSTFQRRSDTVYIVCPRSTFAISAVCCLSISSISLHVISSCAPTTVLYSEDYHVSLTSNLVAFVNCMFSQAVVSTEMFVWTFNLRYCTLSSVFPTAKRGVRYGKWKTLHVNKSF